MNENQGYERNQHELPNRTNDIETQLKELREQVANLTGQAASSAKTVAAGFYDATSGQAREISDVAKAYPAAVSTISIGGVLAGIVIGLLLGGVGSR